MRRTFGLFAASLGAIVYFTGAARAEPVAIAPISFAPELQARFDEDYGNREEAYLESRITRAVSRALEAEGAQIDSSAGLRVEITLVSADPNKPTYGQISRTPGLDYGRSFSRGGAELTAVIKRADGEVIAEVHHRRFSPTIEEASFAGTWGDADRAVQQFARRVARAYVGQATHVSD